MRLYNKYRKLEPVMRKKENLHLTMKLESQVHCIISLLLNFIVSITQGRTDESLNFGMPSQAHTFCYLETQFLKENFIKKIWWKV